MIYGRFGNPVTIVRRAVLADVKKYENRRPDKADKIGLANGAYWIARDNDTNREKLYSLAYLRADDGSREITAAIEALENKQ